MAHTATIEVPVYQGTIEKGDDGIVRTVTVFSPDKNRWRIDHADVIRATAKFPEKDRQALLWLDDHAREKNLTLREIGSTLKKADDRPYNEDTVYKILTGRHDASIANFVRSVQTYRSQQVRYILPSDDFPFVKTALAKSIWEYADLVWTYRRMGLLIGDSQAGKSRTLREYKAAHPERDILYHQLPTDGHLSYVVSLMCDQRGISLKYNTNERRLRLRNSITRKTLIIADEIQQCASRMKSGGRSGAERVNTIEFYRWLKDETGCSVLLVGTTEALEMLEGKNDGPDNSGIFIQTLKRALPTYQLKTRPTKRDLNTFAIALGLEPAIGPALAFQTTTIDELGLGYWLTYLQAACGIAAAASRAVTWQDVLDADDIFRAGEEQK
jgi:hypothetical protein